MKTIRWLDRYFEEVTMVAIFVIMIISISAQVMMRFVFDSSIGWSEELARYCFIWMIFLGVSYAVKKQRHIKVDALLLLLKDRASVYLSIAVNLIFLGFSMFLIFYGGRIAVQIFSWGQLSPALEIEMGWVYLAVPIGMALASIRIIQQLISQCLYLAGKDDGDDVRPDSLVSNEADALKNQM